MPNTSWPYTYTRGNPLRSRDPSGRYLVSCSPDDTQCEKDAARFEEARKKALRSKNEGIRLAALAYGARGEDNGVTVGFKPLDNTHGFTTATVQGSSLSMVATVTFQSGLEGIDLSAAIAHEGQHIVDAKNYIATLQLLPEPPWVSRDESKHISKFQTELNAFRLTHAVYSAAGKPKSFGCSGCIIGYGLTNPAEVDLAIRRILANPDGPYKLTPAMPGGPQVDFP